MFGTVGNTSLRNSACQHFLKTFRDTKTGAELRSDILSDCPSDDKKNHYLIILVMKVMCMKVIPVTAIGLDLRLLSTENEGLMTVTVIHCEEIMLQQQAFHMIKLTVI